MIAHLLIFFIKILRPILGSRGCCCFTITCSKYAIMQLKEKKLSSALWTIIGRLIRCNSLYHRFVQHE